MSSIGDILETVLSAWIGAFLFLTGEVLRKVVTLGGHRIRWWEVQDDNVNWPGALLGLAFWLGVGALVYYLLTR